MVRIPNFVKHTIIRPQHILFQTATLVRCNQSIPYIRAFHRTAHASSEAYYSVRTPKGENFRLHLAKSRHVVGIRTTRGTREYNEDRFQILVLDLAVSDGKQAVADKTTDESAYVQDTRKTDQSCYFAVFDGHGGANCADYLTGNLHKRIEDVKASDVDDVILQFRNIGGYFHRFNPRILTSLASPEVAKPPPPPPRSRPSDREDIKKPAGRTPRNYSLLTNHPINNPNSSLSPGPQSQDQSLTLEQRLTLAFLKTDLELLGHVGQSVGSTASIALVRPLDNFPFWSSEELDITVAHIGDTRVLLCDVPSGNAISLTYDHHPNAATEFDRLRKSGGYIITDSFGSDMVLGQVANTRAMGDSKMKKYGISAEPEIVTRRVVGKDSAFLVLVSDGITSVMSNQEIVDCVKLESDPTTGAIKLVDFAETLGSEDNITAMVVRLPGWGSPMPDHTIDLRNYRLENDAPHIRRRT
ncbi:4731_t:CDS:2 [Paraglomus occultum]|uniref:4731_t:CDS:1 n=1 Tax=Paraglomus occultum TaxID=144539 RepID=A0A9N8ZW93_9GLOM|nr:4731_t:CDS:2 [Paraglomus occultum]